MIASRSKLPVVLLAALISLSWAGVSQADFKRDYKTGLKALKKQDWGKAAEKFRKSIEANAEANESVFFQGALSEPYMPYHNLGQALFGMGDCAGAAQAWQTALDQGVIQRVQSEYAKLRNGLDTCQPQDVDVSALASAAAAAIDALRSAGDSYTALSNDPGLAAEWDAEWRPASEVARRDMDGLQRRLELAKNEQDVAAIEAIIAEAAVAKDSLLATHADATARISFLKGQLEQLAALQNAARKTAREKKEKLIQDEQRRKRQAEEERKRLAAIQQRTEAQRRAQEQREELQRRERVATAQRALYTELDNTSEFLVQTAGDTNVRNLRKQLAGLAGSGRNLVSSGSVSDLERQAQAIRDGIRRYRQGIQEWQAEQQAIAWRTPPSGLKEVADAYFSGNYQTASRLADPGKFSDKREKIQAYLFRSASLFNLYWLTGTKNERLIEGAKKDIMQIKQLNRQFSPYIAAFSPKYLEFFMETS